MLVAQWLFSNAKSFHLVMIIILRYLSKRNVSYFCQERQHVAPTNFYYNKSNPIFATVVSTMFERTTFWNDFKLLSKKKTIKGTNQHFRENVCLPREWRFRLESAYPETDPRSVQHSWAEPVERQAKLVTHLKVQKSLPTACVTLTETVIWWYSCYQLLELFQLLDQQSWLEYCRQLEMYVRLT